MSRSLRVLLAAALCAALLVTLAPLALAASGPPPGWTRIATGGLGNPADAAMFGFVNFKGRQYCFVPEMGDPQTAPPAPVLTAERSQYFDYGQGWAGGAFGTGAPAPRKTFYFAEGTTRSNSTDGSFDEWISIQNPNSSTASITLTFVKPDGINIVQKVKVTPGTRSTVSVNQVGYGL